MVAVQVFVVVVTIVVVATAADNIALKACDDKKCNLSLADSSFCSGLESQAWNIVGALMLRIRSWGPFYYNYNKEPPK